MYAPRKHHGGTRASLARDEGYDIRRAAIAAAALVTRGHDRLSHVGNAGAYGYRTYDTTPARSAPSSATADEQDRSDPNRHRAVAGSVGAKRRGGLVSREEQPVALLGNSAVPRVVFPSPVQPAPTAPEHDGSTPPPAAANASRRADQQKRIRPSPSSAVAIPGKPSGEAPRAPHHRSGARTAPQPSRASRDQQLSLDPNAPAPAREPGRPQPQQRVLNRRARETSPPRPLPLPRPGWRQCRRPRQWRYLVQVSSQRSELMRRHRNGDCSENSQLNPTSGLGVPIWVQGVFYAPWSRSRPAMAFSSVTAKQDGGQAYPAGPAEHQRPQTQGRAHRGQVEFTNSDRDTSGDPAGVAG